MIHIEPEFKIPVFDRIYKACIRQCWYLHTVAYTYAHKHVHTLMQLGFMHTGSLGRYYSKYNLIYPKPTI